MYASIASESVSLRWACPRSRCIDSSMNRRARSQRKATGCGFSFVPLTEVVFFMVVTRKVNLRILSTEHYNVYRRLAQGLSITGVMTTFSDRLRNAMRAKGYNQNSLAKELGHASGSRVHAWLSGTLPDGKNVIKLVQALNVDAHWLLMGEHDTKAEPPPSEKEWAFDEIAAFVESVRESSSEAAKADAERQMMEEIGAQATQEIARRSKAPSREGNGNGHRDEDKTG